MSRLTLQPSGKIESGYVDYTIDGDNLAFSGEATAKLGWFKKTFSIDSTFQGKPGVFKKKEWLTVGTEVDFPDQGLVLKVLDIDKDLKLSHVQITEDQYSVTGIASVDISGDPEGNIEIKEVHGQAELPIVGTQQIVATGSN